MTEPHVQDDPGQGVEDKDKREQKNEEDESTGFSDLECHEEPLSCDNKNVPTHPVDIVPGLSDTVRRYYSSSQFKNQRLLQEIRALRPKKHQVRPRPSSTHKKSKDLAAEISQLPPEMLLQKIQQICHIDSQLSRHQSEQLRRAALCNSFLRQRANQQ